jgi:hypothetical protein
VVFVAEPKDIEDICDDRLVLPARSFVRFSSERSSVLCTTLAKETVAFLPFELQYSLLRSTKYEVLRSISDCCLIKRGATR